MLYEKGCGSCGSVRFNRKGIPKLFKDNSIKKSKVTTYQDECILGLKWMDKRPVAVLSTIHDDFMLEKRRGTKSCDGGVEVVRKPTVIEEYNSYMGDVDRADQLVTYYEYPHHSKKWWKRVFFHLLDTALVNSYILYTLSNSSKRHLSHIEFQFQVASGLTTKESSTPHKTLWTSQTPIRLSRCHFPIPGPKRDCKVCSNRKSGKQSNALSNVTFVMIVYAHTHALKSITH